MFGHRHTAPASGIRGLLLVGIAALGVVISDGASAQGLFDFLFGARRAPPPRSATPYADPYPQFGPFGPRQEGPRVESGPSVAYCVRLCDGRFFPIQRNSSANPAQVCGSFCPAARTKIFSGGGIDHAVANDGKRYADLDNAFVYRERTVDGCTCNGKDAYGLVNMPAADDPTLRPGDIVATNQGMVAYRGGRKQSADFTPIESYTGLSGELRRQLADTKIRQTETAPPPKNDAKPSRDADRRVQLER